jgi:serine/threonine-protein kinase
MVDAAAAIAGLAAIHEAGIVHRDVKPDNMLRMEDGRLALSDFGLATDLSNTGPVTVMVGTPHYMAPEIRAGEPATTRSDVWSLGVVLYEIFFGVRPERKSSKSQAGMSKPPPPLTSTPEERRMLALAESCLAESPFERPEDAQQVERMFAAAGSPSRGSRRIRRAMLLAAVSSAVLIVAISIVLGRSSRVGVTGAGNSRLPFIEPSGAPADWSQTARVLASLQGRVHCLSMVGDRTVQIVWGAPRRS